LDTLPSEAGIEDHRPDRDDDLFGDDLIGDTIIDLDDRFFSAEWDSINDKPVEYR
jgi:hypothetical protein